MPAVFALWATVLLFVTSQPTSCMTSSRAKLTAPQIGDRHCEQIDKCRCRFNDTGGVVNLWPLGSQDGTAVFLDEMGKDQRYMYSYNPCYGFSEDECGPDTAICRIRTGFNVTSESLATQASPYFHYDGHNVQLTYVSTDEPIRMSFVSFVCVNGLDTPKFTAYGQTDNSTENQQYHFQVESKCACEDGCVATQPASPDSLSPGTIAVIVVMSVLGLYLVVGTLYGSTIKGATGMKALPNYDFWSSLLEKIKSGCLMVFGQRNKRQYQEV